MDLFLDNLFTDGMVLHQITQAGDRLGALKSRVEILQDRLERKREENQAALDQACAGGIKWFFRRNVRERRVWECGCVFARDCFPGWTVTIFTMRR